MIRAPVTALYGGAPITGNQLPQAASGPKAGARLITCHDRGGENRRRERNHDHEAAEPTTPERECGSDEVAQFHAGLCCRSAINAV